MRYAGLVLLILCAGCSAPPVAPKEPPPVSIPPDYGWIVTFDVRGQFIAALRPEASLDGERWAAIEVLTPTCEWTSAIMAPGKYRGTARGFKAVRINTVAYTSGWPDVRVGQTWGDVQSLTRDFLRNSCGAPPDSEPAP
jgi:hypothetical protein